MLRASVPRQQAGEFLFIRIGGGCGTGSSSSSSKSSSSSSSRWCYAHWLASPSRCPVRLQPQRGTCASACRMTRAAGTVCSSRWVAPPGRAQETGALARTHARFADICARQRPIRVR